MTDSLNLLILSCGSRNKIIQYFKKELAGKGQVIAADCSELAPALYEADKFYIIPRVTDDNYLNTLLEICYENHIKGILTLIDSEISILARYQDEFNAIGAIPIVSSYDTVESCFDKAAFYQLLLSKGIRTVKSYINLKSFYADLENRMINFPVFVKPKRGSASININKVNNQSELDLLFNKYDDLLIQEYMEGTEFGVDVYIDILSGKMVTLFMKEKLKMRAGETDKSMSILDGQLLHTVTHLINSLDFKGVIDIDVFRVNGEYYISEVNPRFGGGYPHAYECGVNIPKLIISNLEGQLNSTHIGEYEEHIYMMKYSDLRIFKNEKSNLEKSIVTSLAKTL